MTQEIVLPNKPDPSSSVGKRMFVGAEIELLMISLFLFSAKEPTLGSERLWTISPLVIVSSAGTLCWFCNYFLFHFQDQAGINEEIAMLLNGIVFIIRLWLSAVLGLDGTM